MTMKNTETSEPQAPGQFAGAHGSAAYWLEPVTVTMHRRDWKLLTDYFEGDVEAMGDNAPRDQQKQARKVQSWLLKRWQKGNSTKRQPNDPSSATRP